HHLGVGEEVEQGGLARVRVPDDRHRRHMVAGTVLPFGLSRRCHGRDLTAQLRHPGANAAAVEFDLRLAGSARADPGTAGDAATGLARQGLAPTADRKSTRLHSSHVSISYAV